MAIDFGLPIGTKSLVGDLFVETGLYAGDTLVRALGVGFNEARSIELDRGRYEAGLRRFAAEPRVRLYHGTSPDVLPQALDPARRTLIYLDGHFSGDDQGGLDPKYGECPVLEELAVVTGLAWQIRPAIVIDDAQHFRRPWSDDLLARFDVRQWPTTAQVVGLLPDDYAVADVGDVLYCLPPEW